jgi:dienelactone hydrolase
MGTILFIIALMIQSAFAAFCIATKSDQNKVKNYLRVVALGAFLLLAIASVIQWGFRWYLLALLLFIWALPAAWQFARRKEQKPGYHPAGIILRAVATLLLVLITLTPVLIFPQAALPKPTGKHPVATATDSFTDPNRVETFSKTGGNREVNVEFWYPADEGGKYPLVVFSHGSFGVKTSNTSTFINLASNGYVVCSIDHPYHSFVTTDTAHHTVIADQAYLQEYLDLSHGKFDDATEFQLETKWMQLRVADINFVLDTVLARAKKDRSDPVYQLIDPGKIGLMGHSLGGEAIAQAARERSDISAVVNLDADLHGEYLSFSNGKALINNQPYPTPILTLLGDEMVRLMAEIPNANETIAEKYVTATAPHAYEIHLAGTDHMSFTDLPLVSPFLVSMISSSVPNAGGNEATPFRTLEKMNGIILSFFDAFLKGQGNFQPTGLDE